MNNRNNIFIKTLSGILLVLGIPFLGIQGCLSTSGCDEFFPNLPDLNYIFDTSSENDDDNNDNYEEDDFDYSYYDDNGSANSSDNNWQERVIADMSWTAKNYEDVTLGPGEGIEYRIPVSRRDIFIADVSQRSDSGDPDIYVRIADESTTIASSANSAGDPENVLVPIDFNGDLLLQIENYSFSESASFDVAIQRIRESYSDDCNGIYRIVSADGTDISDNMNVAEKWIFRNGKLVSRYVYIDLSLIGAWGEFEAWIDHQSGHRTTVWDGDKKISYKTLNNIGYTYDRDVYFRFTCEGVEGYNYASVTNEFSGTLSEDGNYLSGTVNVTGDMNYALYVELERE